MTPGQRDNSKKHKITVRILATFNTTTSSSSWIQDWWTWQLSLEQLHIEWQNIVHYNFTGDAKEYLLNKI